MKWPWVSRLAFDEAKAACAQAQAYCAQIQRQCDALLEHYHALRVQGANAPEPTPQLPPRELDPVMAAITAKAGTDAKLRSLMAKAVIRDRTLGKSDVDIIRDIEQGYDDEQGIPA